MTIKATEQDKKNIPYKKDLLKFKKGLTPGNDLCKLFPDEWETVRQKNKETEGK